MRTHLGTKGEAVSLVGVKEAENALLGKCRVEMPDKAFLVLACVAQKHMVVHAFQRNTW